MGNFFTYKFDGESPVLAAAIHNGHEITKDLEILSALDDPDRLREEDPFTGEWTSIADNRIISHHSRFEFDFNRPPDRAIYLKPEDAWGLQVWKEIPSETLLARTRQSYHQAYRDIFEGLSLLTKKFGRIVVFDLHSYNHMRNGPDSDPEDPELNPEINIGTGTMNRDYWASVVERFMNDMRSIDFFGRNLDIRENIKFKGGYFPKWIHENFSETVCCISIEFKKFFMNEWTGKPDHLIIRSIGDALKASVPGVIEELSRPNSTFSGGQMYK